MAESLRTLLDAYEGALEIRVRSAAEHPPAEQDKAGVQEEIQEYQGRVDGLRKAIETFFEEPD